MTAKYPFSTAFLVLLACGTAQAEYTWTPTVGALLPIAETGDTWQPGYQIGLERFFAENPAGIHWGMRAGFGRMTPDDHDLLRIGDRELKTELSRGWQAYGEALLLAGKTLYATRLSHLLVDAKVGMGLAYLRRSDVHVKGAYFVDDLAVTRDIFMPSRSELPATLSGELTFTLFDSIKPGVRIQRLFDGEGSTWVILQIGLISKGAPAD